MAFKIWCTSPWSYDWFDGVEPADVGCGEMVSLRRPEYIAEWHRRLLAAGSDAISTNTMAAQPSSMAEFGVAAFAAEANRESARIARAVCREYSTPTRKRLVLGAMGPTWHLLSLQGGGPERVRSMESEYRQQAEALLTGGVDMLHLERCMDLANARAALSAIRSLDPATPVMITGAFEAMGTLLDGTSPEAFFDFARIHNPARIGVSGDRPWVIPLSERLISAGRAPGALFLNVFWPGGAPGDIESPASFTAALTPLAQAGSLPVLGIGTLPHPDFVAALNAVRESLSPGP